MVASVVLSRKRPGNDCTVLSIQADGDGFANLNDPPWQFANSANYAGYSPDPADHAPGDHVLILRDAQPTNTDTVALAPEAGVAYLAVGILAHTYNNGPLTGPGGVRFVWNPNRDPHQATPAMVFLWDNVPQQFYDPNYDPNENGFVWDPPSLVFFPFEADAISRIDLNPYHFRQKAAAVSFFAGPGFSHVRLLEKTDPTSANYDVPAFVGDDPPPVYEGWMWINLNNIGWADRAAAVQFIA